ncbi:hypothetical protein TNCV_4934351 [Trichonephila clavipes]|nr:hypothetical protein TNCV_4934351 [Trichonephila clavipes]
MRHYILMGLKLGKCSNRKVFVNVSPTSKGARGKRFNAARQRSMSSLAGDLRSVRSMPKKHRLHVTVELRQSALRNNFGNILKFVLRMAQLLTKEIMNGCLYGK